MRWSMISILVFLSVAPLRAQSPSLEPGMLLRIHAQGSSLQGRFMRWQGDSLVVSGRDPGASTRGWAATRAMAASDIERLEIGTRRSGSGGAGRGALWGGLFGSLLGVVAGLATSASFSSYDWAPIVGGVLVVGAFGAGVGAVIGAVSPGMQWEPMPIPSPDESPSAEDASAQP